MKTEGQVRHKLQQVTYRHLQRAIRTKLSRRPENCENNRRVKLPMVGDGVRFCSVRKDADGDALACDESYDGLDQSAQCKEFRCSHTKDGVKDEFAEFLRSSDTPTIAVHYPDVAALLWAMGGDVQGSLDVGEDPDSEEVDPDPKPTPGLPYTLLYLYPDGGAAPLASYTLHRAVVYNSVVFSGGRE
jgi:hypothetical protein